MYRLPSGASAIERGLTLTLDVERVGELDVRILAELFGGRVTVSVGVATFRDGFCDPQCIVELGAERIGAVGGGPDTEERQILQRRQHRERADPRAAAPCDQCALVDHVGEPSDLGRAEPPAAVLPRRDVIAMPGPRARRARARLHDPALTLALTLSHRARG